MKVCTDACLFGAWLAEKVKGWQLFDSGILDLGAGTGLLSLMLAQQTTARIDAVELDENAAEQAAENFDTSPWRNRLQVIQNDIRTVHLGKKYQIIISNPPFFENDLKSPDKQRNLALHSETLSFEDLLNTALIHLSADGKFAVLLPWHRKTAFEELAIQKGWYLQEEMAVRQTPAHVYFRAMLLLGKTQTHPLFTSITLREGTEYTPAFAALLKEYYLKL